MDAIPDATDEELEAFPNYMCTFHKWMQRQGKKEATARAYVRNMALLFEDDGKGAANMATQEYFEITKASFKNKVGNGQRSAAVRAFLEFWASHNGGPLEDAAGAKVYQVKGRPQRARSESVAERLAPEGDEARQLRVDLGLPDEGWSVDIRSRSDGEMILAVSPNGSAYRSRQAVQRRLSQNNSQEAVAAAAAASSAAAPAASSSAGSRSQTSRQAKPPSEEPPAALPRTASAGSSAPARPPPSQTGPVRRTIPLSEALARFNSGAQALLSSGRDPAARLAQRIHGLYFVQDESVSGRPVFRKLDEEKPTVVFFNEAKGLWRMTETMETKGDFAKVKDDAQAPWEISRPWRVYNGEAYEEDPNLRLTLLDSSAVAQGAEVEVCASFDDSEATPVPASGAAGTEGEEGSPVKKAKLEGKEDSKKDTPVKTKRKSKEPENQEDEKAAEEEPGGARHTIALAEALSRFSSSGDREAVLVSGRKASAKNAQRVNGLYLREEVDGGVVWTKVGCQSKFAAISFNSAKGQWQISKGLDTKGDYAHTKDKAENPWEVKKTWKAFDGEAYVEDPDISVSLIDRTSVPDVQVEVDHQPSSSSRQPTRETSACSLSQASQASSLLPQDAPEDHIAHHRLKFEHRSQRVTFHFLSPDGKRFQFQATVGASGSRENAEVIARACYVKFEEGFTKDQVIAFRKECYDRLKSGGSTASLGGSTSAGAEDDPHGHKKRRRDEEQTEKDPDAKSQAKAARKKSSKSMLGEEPASAQVAEAADSAPAAEAAEAEKANSDDESSSTSSSSASDGEDPLEVEKVGEEENGEAAPEEVEKDEVADAGQVGAPSRKPLRPTGPLGRLGRVAAKMSVRTGLRCWCCYETACVKAHCGGEA